MHGRDPAFEPADVQMRAGEIDLIPFEVLQTIALIAIALFAYIAIRIGDGHWKPWASR
jgi:hypothetical protein